MLPIPINLETLNQNIAIILILSKMYPGHCATYRVQYEHKYTFLLIPKTE